MDWCFRYHVRMSILVFLHTVTAVTAILCGVPILYLRKGSISHRRIGRVYVAAILAMCLLSVFIRDLRDGSFSVFHVITMQTVAFLTAGVVSLTLRNRIGSWFVWHARFMLYSYVTLIVTGIAQAFEYLPFDSDLANAIVFIQLPAVLGWILVEFRGLPAWRKALGPHLAIAR